MQHEIIDTSLNISYHVTTQSCENTASDHNYYSVIPSVNQEEDISGTTPIKLRTNKAYGLELQEKTNHYYEYVF